jgi:hypothetical protein
MDPLNIDKPELFRAPNFKWKFDDIYILQLESAVVKCWSQHLEALICIGKSALW